MLERLGNAGSKTAAEKCKFFKKEVDFLGFVVGVNSICMDLEKIKSIVEWPTPQNTRRRQAFIGLPNYNRKFIQDYSKIAIPLTTLTKKDVKFDWGKDQERFIRRLEEASTSAPILAMFEQKTGYLSRQTPPTTRSGPALHQKRTITDNSSHTS